MGSMMLLDFQLPSFQSKSLAKLTAHISHTAGSIIIAPTPRSYIDSAVKYCEKKGNEALIKPQDCKWLVSIQLYIVELLQIKRSTKTL